MGVEGDGVSGETTEQDKRLADRATAWASLEKAFWRKDADAFYAGLDAFGRACYELGVERDVWNDITPTPPPPQPLPEGYEVHSDKLKIDGPVYYVIPKGGDPKSLNDIVAICATQEKAERVARALGAYEVGIG